MPPPPTQERPWGGGGPEVDPSSCPPAHFALLSDTCIDLTGRYGHRLAALLSTAAPSPPSACKQRLNNTGFMLHSTPPPPLHPSHCHYMPSGGAGRLMSGIVSGAQTCWHTSPPVLRRRGSRVFAAMTDQHTLTKDT